MSSLWSYECHVPFTELSWIEDAPGIRACETSLAGRRWAIVEYEEEAQRREWCEDGHVGFVLRGAVEYEFADGGDSLRAAEGEAFCLSTGRAHRGRNVADQPTRLFLIDDPYVA